MNFGIRLSGKNAVPACTDQVGLKEYIRYMFYGCRYCSAIGFLLSNVGSVPALFIVRVYGLGLASPGGNVL